MNSNSDTTNRPLLSFVLLAYNQERYIAEAVQGALAQTYSPLEIILSDDCSTDRTFDIMQRLVAGYSGPHTVRLNRNAANLGLARHTNRAMSMVAGEYVVAAAGDDVSYPERARWTYEAWRQQPSARSIYFLVEPFFEPGASAFEFVPAPELHAAEAMIPFGGPRIVGAAHSWHRSVFDVFGGLPEADLAEDKVIPFRSALLGQIVMVERPAVKYRVHSESLSTSSAYAGAESLDQYRERALRGTRRRLAALESYLADIETAMRVGLLDTARAARLRTLVERTRRKQRLFAGAKTGAYLDRLGSATRLLFEDVETWPVSSSVKIKEWLHVAIPFLDNRRFERGRQAHQHRLPVDIAGRRSGDTSRHAE
jgi:glycosyltransferase involved in cell wall biosynthesis